MVTRKPRDPHGYYEVGATPIFACRYDQRFSYALYVPSRSDDEAVQYPLVVVQHGTERSAAKYRDHFADFADRHRCVVLAPLFPAGIGDARDLHNYKFIAYGDIRFDHVLLAMVDEVTARFPVDSERFLLFGFSGGGQFSHRFLYLHPHRLAAASIGAPGRVTLIDDRQPWWLGTADVSEIFGTPIDLDAIRTVGVQLVVGSADTETWEINNPGDSNWMDGADAVGRTRIDRLRALERNYREHGVDVEVAVVPGVAHDGLAVLPAVQDFFGRVLCQMAATPAGG